MGGINAVRQIVAALQPGECVRVDGNLLKARVPMPGFDGADWVLEGILGSAYEFSHEYEPMTGDIIFRRGRKPCADNLRTSVSPDRREYFRQRLDGLFELRTA